MEEKIRRHIEELFTGTLPTKKAVELKEELIQNLTEKYNDLLGEGKTQEAAYNIVIAGIGDVSGLLKDLERDSNRPPVSEQQRQRSAMLTAVAVMLYIISIVPVIVFSFAGYTRYGTMIGVSLMFLCAAVATGLLVYNGLTKPKYRKADETMVEEFRQWNSERQDERSLRSSMHAALWSITVALYFIVSFLTGWWHITWVIFILAVAANAILNIAFAVRKK